MPDEVIHKYKVRFIFVLGALLLLSIPLALWADNYYLLAPPVAVVGFLLLVADYRLAFYLLILSIPPSVHLTLGSLAVDMASEPLMVMLLFVFPLVLIVHFRDFDFLKHPVVLLLLGQLLWAVFSTIFSTDYVRSLKYLAAKLWYIVPFVFLGGAVVRSFVNIKHIFWLFFLSLLLMCIMITMIHYRSNFSFETSSIVMFPWFHNHVLYSTTIMVFLPFVWFARHWYPKGSVWRMLLNFSIAVFLFAVATTYTRASWLAAFLLIPCYFLVKLRLTKLSVTLAALVVIGAVIYLNYKNQYLEYAIEYRKVIFHEGDIEKHLEATYQFEDVSGMERVYRWVAAQKMIMDNWMVGTGPSTFYPEYKRYTVNLFATFVSDNTERSTTHNYFLMVFTEQGFIGFLLFTGLYIYLLIKGTELYASSKNREHKEFAMAVVLSLLMLALHLFLNDLIETDKVGALFYLSCMFMMKLDEWKKREDGQERSLQEQ